MPSAALIFNEASGSHLNRADAKAVATDTLIAAGFAVTPMEGKVDEQIRQSLKAETDIIVVGGGDGTIRATIEAHLGGGRPIGILPGGTMNLLATDYGIPEDVEAAARVIADGHLLSVDCGDVDGHLFLHTLFTGLPVRMGVHREARRGKLRMLDRIRLAAHAITTLPRDPKLTMEVATEAGERTIVSPSFAVIVGTMSDNLLPRPHRDTVSGGLMTVFAIHPDSGVDVARLVVRGAFGQLAEDPDVDKMVGTAADLRGPRRRMHAMLDGEDALITSPCKVRIRTGEVQVFAPKEPQ